MYETILCENLHTSVRTWRVLDHCVLVLAMATFLIRCLAASLFYIIDYNRKTI